MLSLSLPGRVFLCTLPTDMRKSFDALAALVREHLEKKKRGRDQSHPLHPLLASSAFHASAILL